MIRRRQHRPERLRVKGVKVTMTPAPDDAELAAQALLETLCGNLGKKPTPLPKREGQGVDFYKALAQRIHEGKAMDMRNACRSIVYCEQELGGRTDEEKADEITKELYRHADTVRREGGELLRRWQYCMAKATTSLLNIDE